MAAPDVVTLDVETLDRDGLGVGVVDAVAVHVRGVLPGERARVRLEHRSPHAPRAWGALLALDGPPSPARVARLCPDRAGVPAGSACGGCVLQHMAYADQLAEKGRRLSRALDEWGVRAPPPDPVEPSARIEGYRNKAKYVLATSAGELGRGSWAPGTHRFVDMAGCRVPEPPIDAVAAALVARLGALGSALPVYDEATRTGELRYLVVRANDEGRVLVVIVTRTRAPEEALRRVADALRRERAEVAGVVQNVNPTPTGVILGDQEVILSGAGALADRVGKVLLDLPARAFFQVNRAQAARLYEAVADEAAAGPGVRAVDLYSGVGGIALRLAMAGANVAGVESDRAAVDAARRSARSAGLESRATFEIGDAAAGLPAAARAVGGPGVVIVNPPRRGLHDEARAALAALAAPRLVYVSCGPESLARDLVWLADRGWETRRLRPFDLLPGTPHVETVATLVRGP